ncbi:YARHG domain-containing protein [Fusibacter ferrireducens]|uniref:YARHG domain-containing protein n=1 Tax=Fusibacter ferrireducens TaxID=2785058 RepID=A0ABR9ZYJ6_9FIRM|nr:YARHG domain-containing protein [Fusibacter ferrireducens]MBF4694654.1 YARHG domain-containing protein [Fusibacter ferrireducens]
MKENKKLIYIPLLICLLTFTACSKFIPVDKTKSEGTSSNVSNPVEASVPKETETPSATEISKSERSPSEASPEVCLFENSDQIKLELEDIAGYDALMLRVGLNEIYARKGYAFKDAYWKQYFESQSWYKVNENFSEADFSEVERANIAFLKEQKAELSSNILEVDFDGDGIKEHVTVDASIITKLIDAEEKWYPWDDSYMGALVTDIDITDGERELLLYDAGPSADYTSALCRYNPETQDWTIVSAQSTSYFDHEADGKGHIKLETFQYDIYEMGLFEYNQGKLNLIEITYPEFTLSKTVGALSKGTKVTIEPIESKPEKGEKAALKIIEVAHPENSEILYVEEESPYEFGRYFGLMQAYFDEVTEMYYGD